MKVKSKNWDVVVKKDHCPFLYPQHEYRNCGNWESDTGVCEIDSCPIINDTKEFKEIDITNALEPSLDEYLLSATGKQMVLNTIKGAYKCNLSK